MSTNWSGHWTLVLFVVIMVVGFFVWIVVIFLLWLILQVAGLNANYWAMVESLSTAVAAAGLLSAGFIAYRELSEAASSRHIEVADRLFNELNSQQNIAARRWIYQNLPDDPQLGLDSLDDEGRSATKQVLNSLDRVAFLTQSGWIPDEVIMPWMNPMIVKAWIKLGPYVDLESRRRGEQDYYLHARKLAERCISWREKNLPDTRITWIDDAL
ncbi:MAG: hypothetical protein PVF74_01445 [Anaerolineales bacterium]|jgi:hypothetical protein